MAGCIQTYQTQFEVCWISLLLMHEVVRMHGDKLHEHCSSLLCEGFSGFFNHDREDSASDLEFRQPSGMCRYIVTWVRQFR